MVGVASAASQTLNKPFFKAESHRCEVAPSNAGALSGFSAAAIPSLHTELGLRFEF